MTTRTYKVKGMTCEHCVMSVKEEISEIPDVEDVQVDLPTGLVTVTGEGFTDSLVKDAVKEAGYEVVK